MARLNSLCIGHELSICMCCIVNYNINEYYNKCSIMTLTINSNIILLYYFNDSCIQMTRQCEAQHRSYSGTFLCGQEYER